MRTTHKEVEKVFKLFINAINGRIAESYKDVGKYTLDYQSTYGGYLIIQYTNEQGGEHPVFGMRRRTPSQMVDVMNFAIESIKEIDGLVEYSYKK